jgi:hypothetical protein
MLHDHEQKSKKKEKIRRWGIMKKNLSVILSGLILAVGIAVPAKAAYYTDGTQYAHADYLGKLNLWMDGNTRYGCAGTYVRSGVKVDYLDAVLYDNSVRVGQPATDTWNTSVTTATNAVSYSGITSKHYVNKNGVRWTGYL